MSFSDDIQSMLQRAVVESQSSPGGIRHDELDGVVVTIGAAGIQISLGKDLGITDAIKAFCESLEGVRYVQNMSGVFNDAVYVTSC